MRIDEALKRFSQMCADEGLDRDALMPWPTWKVFKAFMREPVNVSLDGASFQCGPVAEGNEGAAFLAFVRVFSDVDAAQDDEELLEGIVAEFDFGAAPGPAVASVEVHSHDFPSFNEFVQQVESLPEFQALMNREPVGSEIYAQEL